MEPEGSNQLNVSKSVKSDVGLAIADEPDSSVSTVTVVRAGQPRNCTGTGRRLDPLWGPPSLVLDGYRGKAAFVQYRGEEWVGLQLQSTTRLHDLYRNNYTAFYK
jgi:hypothetical protein